MSRTAIAVPLGLLGFLLYVGAVVALADHVMGLHWVVQTAYFIVAGVAWAWPAQRLIYWAARKEPPRRAWRAGPVRAASGPGRARPPR